MLPLRVLYSPQLLDSSGKSCGMHMRCRRGVFKKNLGIFGDLGNTILTMGLVYLVPICSFSPNQKKKETKTPNKKSIKFLGFNVFQGLKKNYNPKKKHMLDSNRKMSSSLECSHLFFFSLRKKEKKTPKNKNKKI